MLPLRMTWESRMFFRDLGHRKAEVTRSLYSRDLNLGAVTSSFECGETYGISRVCMQQPYLAAQSAARRPVPPGSTSGMCSWFPP